MADNDKENSIEKFLDLPMVEPTKVSLPALPEPTEAKTYVQTDYEYSRDTLRDAINEGLGLFKEAASLARQGQQPEHYQVAANLMKSVVDGGQRLLELSKTHQKVTGAGMPSPTGQTVNNTMNIKMSSSEFLKMVKKAQKADDDGEE